MYVKRIQDWSWATGLIGDQYIQEHRWQKRPSSPVFFPATGWGSFSADLGDVFLGDLGWLLPGGAVTVVIGPVGQKLRPWGHEVSNKSSWNPLWKTWCTWHLPFPSNYSPNWTNVPMKSWILWGFISLNASCWSALAFAATQSVSAWAHLPLTAESQTSDQCIHANCSYCHGNYCMLVASNCSDQ